MGGDDFEDEDLVQEDRDFLRDLARRGQESFIVQWFRIFLIVMFIIVIFAVKGGKAALVMTLLIGPVFFFIERLLVSNHEQEEWKTSIVRDEFRYSPLQKLSCQVERASEGSQTQRAFVEERIRDQIVYRLKNNCDVTEKELKQYIKEGHRERIQELTHNEKLTEFLLTSTDIDSLIKKQSRAAFLGKEEKKKEYTGKGFREEMEDVIQELEGWTVS